MQLPQNATATDVIDLLAEEAMNLVERANAGTALTKQQFAAAFNRAFAEALPKFLASLAAADPALAERVVTRFAAEQQAREEAERRAVRRPVEPWSERLKHALERVYSTTQVAELLDAEGSGALSTVLGKRCDETGEDPAEIMRQIPMAQLAFALEADAPGAFLASRIRQVPTP